MKTRDRILHKSLELFNDRGEPNVTTLLISDELDISPGNLYYHFKSKSDILINLFSWYEEEMSALLEVPDRVLDIEDQWFFLHLIFEHIEKYRFIYNDVIHLTKQNESIKLRFTRLAIKKRKASFKILKSLQQEGNLEATDDELEALCENIVLTATFWLNYSIIMKSELSDDALARGVYQILSQVAPFLGAEQREQLNNLKKAYL